MRQSRDTAAPRSKSEPTFWKTQYVEKKNLLVCDGSWVHIHRLRVRGIDLWHVFAL